MKKIILFFVAALSGIIANAQFQEGIYECPEIPGIELQAIIHWENAEGGYNHNSPDKSVVNGDFTIINSDGMVTDQFRIYRYAFSDEEGFLIFIPVPYDSLHTGVILAFDHTDGMKLFDVTGFPSGDVNIPDGLRTFIGQNFTRINN